LNKSGCHGALALRIFNSKEPLSGVLRMKDNILLAILASGTTAGLAHATPANPNAAAVQCKASESVDFSGIQDAPTQVREAKLVDPTGNAPGYCQVQGYVTPQVGFELLLTVTNWNGKFIHLGAGGHGGDIWPGVCSVPIARRYACLQSDMGAQGYGWRWFMGLQQSVGGVGLGLSCNARCHTCRKVDYTDVLSKVARTFLLRCRSIGGRQALRLFDLQIFM
jgi:hypothetical protein